LVSSQTRHPLGHPRSLRDPEWPVVEQLGAGQGQ